MFTDDTETLGHLGRMVMRMAADTSLREDLMQEALIHLWQVQEHNPGQTKNWYVQNCRFHLLHYLATGRSVDSLKRRNCQVQPRNPGEGAPDLLDTLESSVTLLEEVSARDIFFSLSKWLTEREIMILRWLAEGHGTREIARRLKISHPMVIKHRRKIAAIAQKLSIDPLPGRKPIKEEEDTIVLQAS
jgi:RNA polymerase sigma factor (sigma-70 family)